MREWKFLAIIVILFVFYSCTKNELTFKVSEENGIRITQNTGVPADSTFNIELREVAFIENDTETYPEKSFKQASCMDFDDNGNLFVLDRKLFKVFKYDQKGKFLISFGAHGHGPGEFINPGTVICRNDTLFVTDFQGYKINKFDTNGDFIGSKQCQDMAHFPFTPSKFAENYITSGSSKNSVSEDGIVHTIIETSLYNNRFDFIKDIYVIKSEQPALEEDFDPSEKGIKAAASDTNVYVYVHSKIHYKLDVYDTNGNKIREIKKYYTRIQNPKEIQKKYEEIWAKRGRKYKSEFRNSIYNLYTDKYNRLWVSCPSRKKEEGSNFDIFENDKFINRVKLKIDNDYIPFFVGDKIVGVNYNINTIKIYEY